MLDRPCIISCTVVFAALTALRPAEACSSLIVTPGASADGSTFITYTCDGEFHPHLRYIPAADHEPGTMITITDWSGNLRGEIPQVAHTYAVVGLMNEHQLTISETTSEGRLELQNPDGLLHYWDLMRYALQRATTAREAIDVMTSLVNEHGYRSTGETFSIADPHEAWIMEMIGPGPGGAGAIWVARRVPDGMICFHANKARIGEFPLDDPENCRYAENAISFAIEKGYYDPESGEPFRFCDVYCPPTPANRRYASARVWSAFRRAAPSLKLPPDYHRGVEGAEPYPLFIKPDGKLGTADVFALMRDHYEGTDYDMTQGVDAGPFGCPSRLRPVKWQIDDTVYAWERSISTQQTGFSFVGQCRDWLPDAIGGVYWYGVDDTYTTCYVPLYCCINKLPESYTIGSLRQFSWDSAWWVFNFVANYAWLRYSSMIEDIQTVQQELEGDCLALQPAVEQTALQLIESDHELMVRYLTDYSVTRGDIIVKRWRELAEHLLTKYNDGYIKDENGRAREAAYPEPWLRKVLKNRPGRFYLQPAPPPDEPLDTEP